jgi:hypothetical protein
MFHLELRQFPHKLSRFNLSEAQLRAVIEPIAAEKWVEIGERKWNPHEVKVTILEGPELEVAELSMGRGWQAALRHSTDVTEHIMELAKDAAEQAARKALEEAGRAALAGEGGGVPGAHSAGGDATSVDVADSDAPAAGAQALGGSLGDPLAVGVLLASLLGSEPTRLLEEWRAVAAGAPVLAPSESLAVAEQRLASHDRPID